MFCVVRRLSFGTKCDRSRLDDEKRERVRRGEVGPEKTIVMVSNKMIKGANKYEQASQTVRTMLAVWIEKLSIHSAHEPREVI
jgi:hypothetical protein